MSHGDRITRLPPGFKVKATSANAPFALIEDEKRRFYGLMFHPEVVHTPDGAQLIANFVPQGRRAPRRLDHGAVQGRGYRSASAPTSDGAG